MSRRDAKKRLLAFETKVYNPAMAWIRAEKEAGCAPPWGEVAAFEEDLCHLHGTLLLAASWREAQETGPVDADPVIRDPD